MVSIEELQRSIAEEKKKLKKAQELGAKQIEKSTLQKELFRLKHRKAIAASGKGARLLRRAGKGLIKAGKKAAPIIRKQARLIRIQQLRDEALERVLKKKRKKIKPMIKKDKKKPVELGIFKDLDF